MIHKVKRMVVVILAVMLTLALTACGQIPLGKIVSTPDGETIQAVSGTVTIKRGDETLTAKAGTTLNDGDIILTAANSTAWLQLGADRSIQMGENTVLIMLNRDDGYAWRFESGEVTVRIDRPMSGSERFALSVKNVNILVRGTSYTVTMLEELEQQLAQLERFKASIESIIATLESVKTPAATELLIRYKTLHIQVQGAINLVHGYIAILSIEVHDGIVVIEDEDGNEIEELSDGQDMVIGIDDTDNYDEESIIIIDDPGDIISIINPPSTTEPLPPPTSDNSGNEEAAPWDLIDGFHTTTHTDGAGFTWVYEGYWQNGLPNGQGTMTSARDYVTVIFSASFVDGIMNGTVTQTNTRTNPFRTDIFTFDVVMGIPHEKESVSNLGQRMPHNNLKYGVPPWGFYPVDYNRHNNDSPMPDTSWQNPTNFPDGFHRYETEGGFVVYEGYWIDGLPNGQGTLTYDNNEGRVFTYTGNFANGLLHGMITMTAIDPEMRMNVTFTNEFNMGISIEGERVVDGFTFSFFEPTGVPPWGIS